MNNRQVGNSAENISEKYLRKLGYKILDRNFTIRGGEIDIIALYKGIVIFVEVKARHNHDYGLPIESLSYFIITIYKSFMFSKLPDQVILSSLTMKMTFYAYSHSFCSSSL